MKKFAVVAALATAFMGSTAVQAADLEVTHWWTSAGEAADAGAAAPGWPADDRAASWPAPHSEQGERSPLDLPDDLWLTPTSPWSLDPVPPIAYVDSGHPSSHIWQQQPRGLESDVLDFLDDDQPEPGSAGVVGQSGPGVEVLPPWQDPPTPVWTPQAFDAFLQFPEGETSAGAGGVSVTDWWAWRPSSPSPVREVSGGAADRSRGRAGSPLRVNDAEVTPAEVAPAEGGGRSPGGGRRIPPRASAR